MEKKAKKSGENMKTRSNEDTEQEPVCRKNRKEKRKPLNGKKTNSDDHDQ